VTGWLLDTNVLSELRRPKPERKVLAFVAAQPLDLLYVSAVTLAEIRFGIELVADAGRRAELNDWLAHKVRPMFEQRVLAITEDVMFKWRLLVEDGRKAGHTFSQPDLIIAATALHHGLTVVTRDVSDYQKARAPVLNPVTLYSPPNCPPFGLGPLRRGRGSRPVVAARRSRKVGEPSGRPIVSAALSADIASTETGWPRRSANRPALRSMSGATLTSPSSCPSRCAFTLDQRQSSARATSRARTGFSAT
jgi:predicted nucleic acid-binding protein